MRTSNVRHSHAAWMRPPQATLALTLALVIDPNGENSLRSFSSSMVSSKFLMYRLTPCNSGCCHRRTARDRSVAWSRRICSDLITANPFLFEHLELPLQLRLTLILLLRPTDKHGLAIELCAVHVLYGLITEEKSSFPGKFLNIDFQEEKVPC